MWAEKLNLWWPSLQVFWIPIHSRFSVEERCCVRRDDISMVVEICMHSMHQISWDTILSSSAVSANQVSWVSCILACCLLLVRSSVEINNLMVLPRCILTRWHYTTISHSISWIIIVISVLSVTKKLLSSIAILIFGRKKRYNLSSNLHINIVIINYILCLVISMKIDSIITNSSLWYLICNIMIGLLTQSWRLVNFLPLPLVESVPDSIFWSYYTILPNLFRHSSIKTKSPKYWANLLICKLSSLMPPKPQSYTIAVVCKPHAHESTVTLWQDLYGQSIYQLSVTSAPVDGQANKECIALLSDYLNIPKSSLKIVRWTHSRHKIVEITKM